MQVNSNGGFGGLTIGPGLTSQAGSLEVLYGTAPNTAAQGNDSRITGALQTTGGAMSGAITLNAGGSLGSGQTLAGGILAPDTLNLAAGVLTLGTTSATGLVGNTGNATTPDQVAIGAGLTIAGATLSNAGVLTFNTRAGAISLLGSDVSSALGYTPVNPAAPGTFSGALTLGAGGTIASGQTLSGGIVAPGTFGSGGTVALSGVLNAGTVTSTVTNSTVTASGSGAQPLTLQAQHFNDAVYVTDFLTASQVSNFVPYADCTETAGTLNAASNSLTLSACSIPSSAAGNASIYIQGAGTLSTVGAATSVTVTAPGEYTAVPHAQLSATAGVYGSGIGADTPLIVTGEVVNIAGWTIDSAGSGCTGPTATFTLPAGATGNTAAQFTANVSGGSISTLGSITVPGAYIGAQPGNYTGGALTVTGGGCTTPPTVTPHYGVSAIGFQTVGQTGHTTSYYSSGWPVTGTTVAFSTNGSVVVSAAATPTITPFTRGLVTTITGVSGSTITLGANAATTVTGAPFVIAYGTDIHGALLNAVVAARSTSSGAPGIRQVRIPPLNGGGAYFVSSKIGIPNSLALESSYCANNSGSSAISTLGAGGTWLAFVDDQNPAVQLSGNGATARCLRIWHPQPTPASGWAPIHWPYSIDMASAATSIKDLVDFNGSRGFVVSNASCTQCYVDRAFLGDFDVGFSFTGGTNDTVDVRDVHVHYLWNNTNSYITSYRMANTIGALIGRADNANFAGIETVQDALGFYFYSITNGGQIGGLYNATFANSQCNVDIQCMQVNDPSTPLVVAFTGGLYQQASPGVTSDVQPFVSLLSNYVQVTMTGANIEGSQGPFVALGSGDGTIGGQAPLVSFSGGILGSPPNGEWGGQTASPFGVIGPTATLSISGVAPYRNGPSTTQSLISGSGTLVYNGSTSPNAQWGNIATPGSLTNCGTASATGLYSDITLTVTGGSPTACTIAISPSLTAVPSVLIQPHTSSTAWNASTDAGHIIIASAGLANGTYEIFGR